MSDVGALVRSARTARGMTQAALAEQLRTSRDWVVRLEKGHPRLEVQRVLDALRIVGVRLEATVVDAETGALRLRSEKPAEPKSKPMGATPSDPFDTLFGTKNG